MKATVGWGKVGGNAMEMVLDSGLTVSSASCRGCDFKPKAAHLVEGKHLSVSGRVFKSLLDHQAMMDLALSLHPTIGNPVKVSLYLHSAQPLQPVTVVCMHTGTLKHLKHHSYAHYACSHALPSMTSDVCPSNVGGLVCKYTFCACTHIPFPNNPTAYTRVTRVSTVGVTVTVCFLVVFLMPFLVKSTFQESLMQNTQETYVHDYNMFVGQHMYS